MHAIKLRKDGVEIDGKTYKIGDVLQITNSDGKTFEGEVRFGEYDGYHLGFTVEDPKYPLTRFTLIDLLDREEDEGWKIEKKADPNERIKELKELKAELVREINRLKQEEKVGDLNHRLGIYLEAQGLKIAVARIERRILELGVRRKNE